MKKGNEKLPATEAVTLCIASPWQEAPVSALELGLFLLYFRAAYLLAYDYASSEPINPEKLKPHGETAKRRFFKYAPVDIMALSKVLMPQDMDIEFATMSTRQDSLALTVLIAPPGLSALSLAAILTGGEVDLTARSIKLPPLNRNINTLRRVFGQGETISSPHHATNAR